MVSTGDIHWLAGLLEGEGYFGQKHAAQCQVGVEMTDADVVKKAGGILGTKLLGPYVRISKGKRCLDTHRAVVSGAKGVGWMMTLHGLMGERRQKQIEKALLNWRDYVAKPVGWAALRARDPVGWRQKWESMQLTKNPWSRFGKCQRCRKTRGSKPGQNCDEGRHEVYYDSLIQGKRLRRAKGEK